MGMTMTQKILARAAGLAEVHAGDLIEADLDLVLGNDITSPVAIHEMDRFSSDRVFDKDKIALVMDHFIPNKDIKSAEHCKCVREYAMKHDITNYFDVGQMGIEHALLPEKGLVVAGDVVSGLSHLYIRRAGRVFHGRRINGHGCRLRDRQGLVQGSLRDPVSPDRHAGTVCERKGYYPSYHRYDRSGRRSVSVDGIHRRRNPASDDGRSFYHSEHGD